jgi:phage shock protein PspC (stress-responsive transcriptional regulator)
MVSQAAIPRRLERARLRRRVEHRLVAGVAGGVADRLNAPVAFVRFFILLAFAWAPWTIAVYAGAALLLPARDRNRPDWDNLVGAGRLGLVFAALWLAMPPVVINEPMGGSTGWYVASVGLLAAGAAVMFSADYRRGRGRSREEARSAVLGALPVAGCAAMLAAAIMLVPDVRWERVVPLAAIAGGAALLLAGRRQYVAPAMLALAAAVVVVTSGARLDGGVGDLRVAPRDPGGEPIVVRRAVGDVAIDLSRLPRSTERVEVEASVGIGDLEITMPPGTLVEVDAGVGRGSSEPGGLSRNSMLQGFDQRQVGVDRISAGRPGRAHVRIVADVGVGTVEISQAPG